MKKHRDKHTESFFKKFSRLSVDKQIALVTAFMIGIGTILQGVVSLFATLKG